MSVAAALLLSIRSLLIAFDDDAVVREFETTPGTTVAEHAMYVAALARMGAPGHATWEAGKLCSAHPSDPWAWYAAAVSARSAEEARTATQAMMFFAGDHPDQLMVAVAEPAPEVDPPTLAQLERAAALTNAVRIHREYWDALKRHDPARLPAAIDDALAREFNPSMMFAASVADPTRRDDLEERILGEAPLSLAAQHVLAARVDRAISPEEKLARARDAVAWPMQYESTLFEAAERRLAELERP